jgi:hypothetical protein
MGSFIFDRAIILFSQICPRAHLVEAAVDVIGVLCVTFLLFGRLELRANAILTPVVRIGDAEGPPCPVLLIARGS